MAVLTTTATCRGCAWTAPVGDWEAVDKAADKHHEDTGHTVATATRGDAAVIAAVTTCHAEREVTLTGDGTGGMLVCGLAQGHDGPVHWDPVDSTYWLAAQPGMTRDQAEAVARRLAVGV